MNRRLIAGLAAVVIAAVAVAFTPLAAAVAPIFGIQASLPQSISEVPGASLLVAPTPTPTETPLPTATPTPVPTSTPSPTPTPLPPQSYLQDSTIVTIYGRGFGIAPVLGRLGFSNNFDELASDMAPFSAKVAALNDGKKVLPAVHLIYGMAIPCVPNDDCLLYLEGTQPDIVKTYIEPAAARGWQVILDTQLGRSDPATQVQRMIDKGYMKYDNVQVALDPEFQSVPGHDTPGIPIGSVQASQINQAQKLLDDYVRKEGLAHKKVLIVHQFGDPNVNDGVPFMIQNKDSLQTFDNVDLVIDMDGVGHPDSKATKYNRITDGEVYPFIHWRGIKLFLPNPAEQAGHYDQPTMTFEAAFGAADTPGGYRVDVKPNVIIIA